MLYHEMRRFALSAFAALLLASLGSRPALAQSPRWDLRAGVPVGSEEERYIRVLQVAGLLPRSPWTLRSGSPEEVEAIFGRAASQHPWDELFRLPSERDDPWYGGWYAGLVRTEAGLIYNSAIPFGENDGALWAGKGLTTFARAGGYLTLGPLRLRLAPEVFATQNQAFELTPNGQSGEAALRDAKYPLEIDHPQRYGDGSYSRLDPGGSTVALHLGPLRIGASTAGQQWGPALRYPLLLGNNAGGFDHLFVETSTGLDLWLLRLHGRYIVGRLHQSDYSPVQDGETRRLMTAAVFAIQPRWLDGLELGAGRLAEAIWPEDGIDMQRLLRPFSTITSITRYLDDPGNIRGENQLAGVFVRWVLPAGGMEIYAEMIRDDFGRDIRHYVVEPDDLGARVYGIQKVLSLSGNRLLTVRGEMVSAELHHSERGDRFQRGGELHPWSRYKHTEVPQGHTSRGQILGSPTAYGGSGITLAADLYHPRGRWTVELSRSHRTDWYPGLELEDDGVADVVYGLRLDAVVLREGWDVTAALTPVWNMNRSVVDGNDVFNLNLSLAVRGLPW